MAIIKVWCISSGKGKYRNPCRNLRAPRDRCFATLTLRGVLQKIGEASIEVFLGFRLELGKLEPGGVRR